MQVNIVTQLRGDQRLLLPTLVFLGVVSTAVGSLGAPLLPTIAILDGVSLGESQWALTISLLTGAIAAPVLGRLSDGRHRRRVIIATLAVVAAGCVLAALPLGFSGLLAGRALQGVGLGLVPLAIAAARDALPADRARPGIALLGVTTAVGLGIGYPVAGLIVEYLGLSAAFWIGAALTLVTLVGVILVVPDSPDRPHRRLDVPGAFLLTLTVTGLLLVCSQGAEWGWNSTRLLAVGAGSVVAGVVWVWWELHAEHPLVDVRLLRRPSVLAADVMVVLVGIGIYPLLSLVVRYVQTPDTAGYGFALSTAFAGLMLVPYSLASFIASRLVRRVPARIPLEMLVAAGTVILIGSMFLFLFGRAEFALLLASMTLAGFGIGVIFAVQPAQLLAGVPPEETGSANSFYQVLRYIGFSLGSALSATVLVAAIPAGAVVPQDSGYSAAAWIGIAALVVGAVVAGVLRVRTTRADRSGPPSRRPVSSP